MVLVTGATGFIGVYLVDELVRQGFDVLVIGRSKLGEAYYKERGIPFIHLDITKEGDFDKLPEVGVNAIVHLAALMPANVKADEYDPIEYIKVNVVGTLNILEFSRKTGVRDVIYTNSHSDVEALWDCQEPIGEDAARMIKYTGDHAMYIISKNAAVDCIEHYSQEYGLRTIVFRLPPVYGYGPHLQIYKDGKPLKTGFEIFIENAIAGKPLEIWGNCTKGRDIVYVKDVVSAIVLVLQKENAVGLYNIASGKRLSLEEEARGIVKAFSLKEQPSKIVYRPDKPNSLRPFLYDITKAKRDLGWSPKYTYEEMLIDYKREMESGRFKFLLNKKDTNQQ